MRTIGEILKKARLEKKLDFEQIEKDLRIRKKYLLALEENSWNRLPSLPYIKGFLRNYSSYLGLKPEEMTAIFRRQFGIQQKGGIIPQGLAHPLNESGYHITPQILAIGIIISFLSIFFGYLLLQYKTYTSPPNLVVNKPLEGETVTSDKIQISGKTDSDAVVSINGQKIALSKTGDFEISLSLLPGINTVTIESTSKFGKKKTISRTIQIQEW